MNDKHDIPLGAPGRCEVWDWVLTHDDAEQRQCPLQGILVRETEPTGHVRLRFVCRTHRGFIGIVESERYLPA